MSKAVSYLRVSTDRQGRSGLGLEAQRASLTSFLARTDWTLLEEFVEIESGKNSDRPRLTKALELCKLTGATLIIAKLDRLTRDAHFLLGLQKAGVMFVAADMPNANNLTVGVMALVAQQEREAISTRTTEALRAAKARGVKLGNPNGAHHLRAYGNSAAVEAVRRDAQTRAKGLSGIISELRADGVATLSSIAQALNDRGILTPRGGRWHKTSVSRLLDRL